MTDIKFFMGLLTLMSSAEEELGLSNFLKKIKKFYMRFGTKRTVIIMLT